jgi:hypothetical protein
MFLLCYQLFKAVLKSSLAHEKLRFKRFEASQVPIRNIKRATPFRMSNPATCKVSSNRNIGPFEESSCSLAFIGWTYSCGVDNKLHTCWQNVATALLCIFWCHCHALSLNISYNITKRYWEKTCFKILGGLKSAFKQRRLRANLGECPQHSKRGFKELEVNERFHKDLKTRFIGSRRLSLLLTI